MEKIAKVEDKEKKVIAKDEAKKVKMRKGAMRRSPG